jgi:hypothetical protein
VGTIRTTLLPSGNPDEVCYLGFSSCCFINLAKQINELMHGHFISLHSLQNFFGLLLIEYLSSSCSS